MYTLHTSAPFTAFMTIREENGITYVTLTATAAGEAAPLDISLEWKTPDIGVHLSWSPLAGTYKRVRPQWGGPSGSNATHSAPLFCDVSYDDQNRLTVACSDAKNTVNILSGVIEESAELLHKVSIHVGCAVNTYTATVRIDTRPLPFYRCVEDAADWWATLDGYAPVFVPDAARRPMYSTWYSFHQNIDIPRILDECRYFRDLGCEAVIVDDGWQTDDLGRGYDYCGDWEPTPAKVPDMKAFADAVHACGMKLILWYSVPFVGIHSKAYERFKHMRLRPSGIGSSYVLDPRYPAVREYLIDCYRNAVLNWGLDGFKLDFIDSFTESGQVADGMDYVSVYDAVDRLMKDVIATLRALKPDILIEFRQNYIGPLMRTFGNMLRASDCPNDSYTNRISTLALRMTAGMTAVHSDMIMWHADEPVELAAFQLTHVLFSVPQISVRHDGIPDDHRRMLAHYLGLWNEWRDVLLDGQMTYKGLGSDFPYVCSVLGERQIGVVYAGEFAYIYEATDEILIVNASMDSTVILRNHFRKDATYTYTVTDCMGNKVAEDTLTFFDFLPLYGVEHVPVGGVIHLKKLSQKEYDS